MGTCYNISEIDGLAQQIVDRFGGTCAQSWACAAVATCYWSALPQHWCVVTNASVCAAAFEGCGLEHAETPDFPPSLTHTPETPETLTSYVDSTSPAEVCVCAAVSVCTSARPRHSGDRDLYRGVPHSGPQMLCVDGPSQEVEAACRGTGCAGARTQEVIRTCRTHQRHTARAGEGGPKNLVPD